jgi:ATPase subunit of ABC transporter with duplicated ATPase domains
MISFTRVSKQYGGQILFIEADFQLNPGEKAGLVGPNGAGKTTIFRLITGEEEADEGEVGAPSADHRLLPAGRGRLKGRTVLAETMAGAGEVADWPRSSPASSTPWPRAGDDPGLLDRYGDVQERFDSLGGYDLEARAQSILAGLGLQPEQVAGDVGALSGGWKMRVALARILLSRPDVLLLDEPTNYLDIESILWLEASCATTPARC